MVDVSIIIPTFNRARFLSEAIESALAQGAGVEVIVVDDGSTDDTPALLTSYGDGIRAFRQANQGPSAARNFGGEQARGEYLFFLDSDDILEAGSIAALCAQARQLGSDRVPFGLASTVDEAGKSAPGPDYGFSALEKGHTLRLSELVSNIMPLWLSLIPRGRFLKLGGLDIDLRLGEDHEFALRLHRSGSRYVATRVPTIMVRSHGGPRLSETMGTGFGLSALQLWPKLVELAQGVADYDASARLALAKLIWGSGRDAARSSQKAAADSLFALALGVDPGVGRLGKWPFGIVSAAVGPYRAERFAELAKSLIRRP